MNVVTNNHEDGELEPRTIKLCPNFFSKLSNLVMNYIVLHNILPKYMSSQSFRTCAVPKMLQTSKLTEKL